MWRIVLIIYYWFNDCIIVKENSNLGEFDKGKFYLFYYWNLRLILMRIEFIDK